MRLSPTLHIATLLATMATGAFAGRPLSTDDASTADAGICQLESWVEASGGDAALVLAPACGIASGLEIDVDYTLPRRHDELRAASSIALKWVPDAARIDTPLGSLAGGLKLRSAFEHPAGANWCSADTSLLALATLKVSDELALHANLGPVRDRYSGHSATLLNIAAAWAVDERALLFVETQLNDRSQLLGGTVNTVGGAWWLVPDRLGLHLTASRGPGTEGRTLWTAGFGWYGLGL